MLRATLLMIGDELLAGETQDRHGASLARVLGIEGYRVEEMRVLPDRAPAIVAALRQAVAESEAVCVSGGLGPTEDDLTAAAVAEALGRDLVLDTGSWEHIQALFAARGRVAPESNRKQALLPAGAEVLFNPKGTAPGHVVDLGRCFVAVLPGPPREHEAMVQQSLLPWLARARPQRQHLGLRIFRCLGLPESQAQDLLRGFEAAHPSLRLGYQARLPELLLKLRADDGPGPALDAAAADLLQLVGAYVYAEGDANLPTVLGAELLQRGLRVAGAESCTAGLTCKLLTDAAGSSAWFDRGFVTYSNEAKTELLGVPAQLIAEHGAVSEEVALAMLDGVLARSHADLGFAITGVAGPGGGSEDKPVGTTYIAWGRSSAPQVHRYRFYWDREFNRTLAAWTALSCLLRLLRAEA